jgi:hypothetical protein
MKTLEDIIKNRRLHILQGGTIHDDGLQATLVHPSYRLGDVIIIASWGGGWEHVSVSLRRRCPTWDEMCMIKDIFWRDDECAVQYHPTKSEYVNNHPYCLHIWKKMGSEFDTPPSIFVGLK